MAERIPDAARKLLQDPNFAMLGTIRKDGTPHVVPTWIDVDGDIVVLNSAEGRAWVTNVRRDPRITITVPSHENPYEYVEIRGRIVEDTHDGADDHIDAMARKYLGQDTYPYRTETEQRVKLRVEPDKVRHAGAG